MIATVSGTDDRRYWERHAKRYDNSLRVLGKPFPRMLELVAGEVEGCARVLEVAAGTGLVTMVIARHAGDVVATDYATAMVTRLEQRVRSEKLRNVRCETSDIYALKFEPGSFDAVVAANVLHLVPDLERALAALRKMVRPGGVLVAPTFCHAENLVAQMVSRLGALTGFPGHRRFTARSLGDSVESAGLRVFRQETIPGLLPVGYVAAARP